MHAPTPTTAYCTEVWGNLVTWSKKQIVVASSAETEFHALAEGTCELIWIQRLMADLNISVPTPMRLDSDNTSGIIIVHNLVQHDRMKHVRIDRHFIKSELDDGTIFVLCSHSLSRSWYSDKSLSKPSFDLCVCKLGMIDIYSSAWEGLFDGQNPKYMRFTSSTHMMIDFLLIGCNYCIVCSDSYSNFLYELIIRKYIC